MGVRIPSLTLVRICVPIDCVNLTLPKNQPYFRAKFYSVKSLNASGVSKNQVHL